MESLKNARGNSKDPGDPQQSKKKNQQQLTAFFKKPDSSSTNAAAHQSEEVAKSIHDADKSSMIPTRQSISAKRESSQGRGQQLSQSNSQVQHQDHSSKNQTPKKTALKDTPSKTRSQQEAKKQQTQDLSDEVNIEEIQHLVDQKLKESQASQYQQNSQVLTNTQEEKRRSLRPRKVENYKQMLEGDEATMKTIQDEQLEIRRKKNTNEDMVDDEDEIMDEAQIERASDDEEDEEYPVSTRKSKRNKKKVIDDDELEDVDDDNSEEEDEEALEDLDNESFMEDSANKRKQKQQAKHQAKIQKKRKQSSATNNDREVDEEETVFIDNLPNDEFEIRRMLKEVKKHIKLLEKQFFEEEDSEKEEELKALANNSKHDEALQQFKATSHMKQFWCIPLSVNVTSFDFKKLADQQMKQGGRLFDVITIDPPWQLSSANPTRGVAIAYDTLNDKEILSMPFHQIQTDGFLFIWVINAKYRFALQMMEEFGYKLVDEIAWVKQTVNGKIAKGHGYYLQHAKETCLVGVKGNVKDKARFNIESDVIFSQRRGQSQKPEEIYEIAEALVPNGYYLEIFGRRNNLHNGWVTIGNEL